MDKEKFEKMVEMMKGCTDEEGMANCCSMMRKMMQCCERKRKENKKKDTKEAD
jgi:hypothetical protein